VDGIGVFVCHCGINIAATVDVEKVVEETKNYPGVIHAEDYIYMCSDPGQNIIRERIREKKLRGVIVAACSPTLHETTFRRTVASAGLNPYLFECANIREQCSWVHENRQWATQKAIRIIKTIVEKLRLNEALIPIKTPVTRRALVIGGGIAGIQASLDIADAGYETILVEREPSIGGHMAQLSETFPTLDCSQCILTPKMVEVGHHPNIKLYSYSEVEEVSGYVGNFKVKIKGKPRFIDFDKCIGCGICLGKCPVEVASEFEQGLATRKAIYIPFPQAVPAKAVIDAEHCLYFQTGRCKICEKFCPTEAVDYNQKEEFVEEQVGAIVVATGYELYPVEKITEYGKGEYKDVINGLQFERLLSASGPTQGEIRRPSDGKIPKTVVFISCAGSRDPEHHLPYCSKICCMYTAKHALLYKHHIPDGEAIVFYLDTRTAGKDYEEFFTRAREEGKVTYIKGKPSRVIKEGDDLVVWSVNQLTGGKIQVNCDMVVLSMAIVSSSGVLELARKLKIQTNAYGFLSEAHPKLRPVESLVPGFYLAGCAQAQKDIPDTVAQASAAAAKVLDMFSQEELQHEPLVATVEEDICSGCEICISVCPYEAREIKPKNGKRVAEVNEALCEGCGACVAACPAGATQQRNLRDLQLSKMVEAAF